MEIVSTKERSKRVLVAGKNIYRIAQPYANLSCDEVEFTLTESDLNDAFDYDAILIHQPIDEMMVKFITEFKRAGKIVVVDSDDDLTILPPSNPVSREMREPGKMKSFKECIREADYIHASTPELKESLHQVKKTQVFLNGIDFEKYNFKKENFRKLLRTVYKIPEENKVVGWFGSMTHHQDLELIFPLIRELLKRKDITIMLCSHLDWLRTLGFRSEHFPNLITVDWLAYDNYIQTMSVVDVSLAPLVNNRFNSGKSELKVMEFAALSTPTVASSVAPYIRFCERSEEKNVFLIAKERLNLWVDAVDAALSEVGVKVGENAKKVVEQSYDLKTINEERKKWWTRILK